MGIALMHTTSMRALACLAAACLALAVASSDSMVEEFAQKENSSTLLDTQDQVVAWKKVSKKIIKACRKKCKDFVGDPAEAHVTELYEQETSLFQDLLGEE